MSDFDQNARRTNANNTGPTVAATAVNGGPTTREEVVQREKDRFGGIKVGSALLGWLTATGTVLVLTAVLAAIGAAIGLGNNVTVTDVANTASSDADTVGIVGGITIAVILLVAYFCGGYVAGRMARFNGAKQGLAVWLWAVLIAAVLAAVGLIAGAQFDVFAQLDSVPSIPLDEGAVTAGSVITVVIVLAVSLAGAILGGLAGMRFHRRVDKAGLGR
jgi:hypothetical protein